MWPRQAKGCQDCLADALAFSWPGCDGGNQTQDK